MKTAATILLMLVLTTMLIGAVGCTTSEIKPGPAAISEEQAIQDIDNSVIETDSEVVIGEMIT